MLTSNSWLVDLDVQRYDFCIKFWFGKLLWERLVTIGLGCLLVRRQNLVTNFGVGLVSQILVWDCCHKFWFGILIFLGVSNFQARCGAARAKEELGDNQPVDVVHGCPGRQGGVLD